MRLPTTATGVAPYEIHCCASNGATGSSTSRGLEPRFTSALQTCDHREGLRSVLHGRQTGQIVPNQVLPRVILGPACLLVSLEVALPNELSTVAPNSMVLLEVPRLRARTSPKTLTFLGPGLEVVPVRHASHSTGPQLQKSAKIGLSRTASSGKRRDLSRLRRRRESSVSSSSATEKSSPKAPKPSPQSDGFLNLVGGNRGSREGRRRTQQTRRHWNAWWRHRICKLRARKARRTLSRTDRLSSIRQIGHRQTL